MLTGPCTNDPYLSELRKRRSAAFVRISTDCQISGLGETYTGYFIPEIVPGIVAFFEPILLGKDPLEIELLWKQMYHCGNFWCRTGVGLQVLSAIEAALWDIKGNVLNTPVWELLNPNMKKKKLFCYATGGPSNFPIERLFQKIEHYKKCGFDGVKFSAGEYYDGRLRSSAGADEAADMECRKLAAVRERFGYDTALMIDGHMGNWPDVETAWNFDTALAVLNAVEPFKLDFFEEPLHYDDKEGYRALCKRSAVTVAGGECLAGTAEWQPYIECDCFDMGQPDAAYIGGFSEFLKVADGFAKRGRKIATHSWAAGGGFMQNIHAGFAAENTQILEIAPDYGPLHSEIIRDSFILKGGFVYPPEKPGLGITLSDETIAKFPFVRGSGEFNSVPGKVLVD